MEVVEIHGGSVQSLKLRN
uniref:Uncharacterized protein n=1 Tax=Arundo donax TaxID=35708 RepID=A0A0A8ZHG5_ARUDO